MTHIELIQPELARRELDAEVAAFRRRADPLQCVAERLKKAVWGIVGFHGWCNDFQKRKSSEVIVE